jgi:hypothetical protein
MKSFFQRLLGRPVQLPPPVVVRQYTAPRRCMYDRISERRLALEAAQRLLDRAKPRGDFCTDGLSIEDVWLRLPGHTLDQQSAIQDMPRHANALSHDSRLVVAGGSRRLLRRIEADTGVQPSIDPLTRAIELLRATLTHCPLLERVADWSQIEVHLFTPSHVEPLIWFETVVGVWPQAWLPGGGFRTVCQMPAAWLDGLLSSNLSMPNHLCVSIDSWANLPSNAQPAQPTPLGEVVSLVSLKRGERKGTPDATPRLTPRITQAHEAGIDPAKSLEDLLRKLCDQSETRLAQIDALIVDAGFEQAAPPHLLACLSQHLPHLTPNQHVRVQPVSGQVGPIAAEWTRIALGCLAARASPGLAQWVLDLTDSDSSSGWIIAAPPAVPTASTGSSI